MVTHCHSDQEGLGRSGRSVLGSGPQEVGYTGGRVMDDDWEQGGVE